MSLPICPAHQLARQPEERRWLVEGLWSDQAVGMVGGEPKLGKSLLALDIAISVASGRPCLRRYPVRQPGRVIVYPAEDPLHVVRERLEGLSAVAGLSLDTLDLHVITRPGLRLDLKADREALRRTLEEHQPRLLILDPFVRLHALDENISSEVAPILGYLRELQRTFAVAVLVVHHARKGAGKIRQGQALRGSSELHGWGDSYLYLYRLHDQLTMSIEHRSAASEDGLKLRLNTAGGTLSLEVLDNVPKPEPPPSPTQRIEEALADLSEPVSGAELRRRSTMRHQDFWSTLRELVDLGRVLKTNGGYVIPES